MHQTILHSKYNIFCILCLTVALSGCNQYFMQKWEDIPMLTWKKSRVVSHTFNISDPDAQYELQLGLRHLRDISLKALRVSLEITKPDKQSSTKEYTLQLKDEKGEVIGQAMSELVDLIQTVEPDWKITQAGEYIFKITQKSNEDELGGIIEVGVVIVKK